MTKYLIFLLLAGPIAAATFWRTDQNSWLNTQAQCECHWPLSTVTGPVLKPEHLFSLSDFAFVPFLYFTVIAIPGASSTLSVSSESPAR